MRQLSAYLTFNGNCRQAMIFYQQCLGGELTFQAVGDSPMAEELPVKMRRAVLQSTLQCEDLLLMASDMVDDNGLVKGNTISLLLNVSSQPELSALYTKLVEGGKATHPLATTFWGTLFGDLVDQFGVHWLLRCDC